jgi:Rieske Fe-S protein
MDQHSSPDPLVRIFTDPAKSASKDLLMKTLMLLTVGLALAVGPALAQTTPPAKKAAPGQMQKKPGDAKKFAPGQKQKKPGQAKNFAPGQRN